MDAFLDQLATVARSPYAFVAYVALLAVWALVAINTTRLKIISKCVGAVPERDRKALLEKEYGFHLKEGMSASAFLRAQRAAYVFYGWMGLLAGAVLLSVVGLLQFAPTRAQAQPVNVSQDFRERISDGSSCTEKNVIRKFDMCLAEDVAVTDWKDAKYHTLRNGGASVALDPARPNCAVMTLQYSDFGRGIVGDCKGHGIVDYEVTLNGVRIDVAN